MRAAPAAVLNNILEPQIIRIPSQIMVFFFTNACGYDLILRSYGYNSSRLIANRIGGNTE
jgi:hypothetical protein